MLDKQTGTRCKSSTGELSAPADTLAENPDEITGRLGLCLDGQCGCVWDFAFPAILRGMDAKLTLVGYSIRYNSVVCSHLSKTQRLGEIKTEADRETRINVQSFTCCNLWEIDQFVVPRIADRHLSKLGYTIIFLKHSQRLNGMYIVCFQLRCSLLG